jgi:transposase
MSAYQTGVILETRLHFSCRSKLGGDTSAQAGKLLEDGQFGWPKIEDGVMRLSAAQQSALIEGLDWRRVRAAKETEAPTLPS